MEKRKSKTVVLVHGAWMVPASWDNFRKAFQAEGYSVVAPAWPGLDRPVAEIRANPGENFGSMDLKAIVDSYVSGIASLSSAPLLVGHSFGGLIVQLLLDRGLGATGVAIDPAPIAGVIADPLSLGAALPVVARWNGWNRPFMLSRKGFAARFANTMDEAAQAAAYDKYVVPAPGRIFYEAAFWSGSGVDPSRRSQPLLITAAEHDRTVAPVLAERAFRRQRRSPAPTAFHTFPNRSHALCFEPGWEEVAGHVIGWASSLNA